MVTYLGGSILITIFALGGSIVSYNLQRKRTNEEFNHFHIIIQFFSNLLMISTFVKNNNQSPVVIYIIEG